MSRIEELSISEMTIETFNTMINWGSAYFIPFAVLCCYRNTIVIGWAGAVNHWTLA